MDRMVGFRATHEAMNARMDAMIGSESADRMHQALGRRYDDHRLGRNHRIHRNVFRALQGAGLCSLLSRQDTAAPRRAESWRKTRAGRLRSRLGKRRALG